MNVKRVAVTTAAAVAAMALFIWLSVAIGPWFWLAAILVAGVAIKLAMENAHNGKRVVTINNVANMSVRFEIEKWTNRGYTLISDGVHTFGKHTLVFKKD